MEASVSSGNKTSFKAGDKKARNEAVLQYAPLVRNIVERIALKIPIREADREDLVNVGMMGLMSAVEKFDERGTSSSRPMPPTGSGERCSTSCAPGTGCRGR